MTSNEEKKVFVSGCYDILHAGHIEFFNQARALGTHLTVSFASKEVLFRHKQRAPSIPDEHKKVLIESLRMVDKVIIGTGLKKGLDFEKEFRELKPNLLVVTTDDKYEDIKKELCKEVGCEYVVLEKTPPTFDPVSTTKILKTIRAPKIVPLRVDFGGGWLDVPSLALPDAFIVNCAIQPLVSLHNWEYERRSGLGGSAAWAILNGNDGTEAELNLGVGWQDPAVINETGLCVWRSGSKPVLDFKRNGDILSGLMALLWTGQPHDTPAVVSTNRNYSMIEKAGQLARKAVIEGNIEHLADAIALSHEAQCDEGMNPLPMVDSCLARKYCGGGYGGYGVYLFSTKEQRDAFVNDHKDARAIEPYTKST